MKNGFLLVFVLCLLLFVVISFKQNRQTIIIEKPTPKTGPQEIQNPKPPSSKPKPKPKPPSSKPKPKPKPPSSKPLFPNPKPKEYYPLIRKRPPKNPYVAPPPIIIPAPR